MAPMETRGADLAVRKVKNQHALVMEVYQF